jgi:hypothetical protein
MASSGAVPYRTYSTSDFVKRFTNVAQSSMFRAVFNIQNLPFTSSFSPSNRYTEDLSILCSEASLPGSRFSTSENNQDYYGISQKFAYRKDFDTIDLTFYVDTGYKTLKFFEQWMDFIASTDETYSVVGGAPVTNGFYRFRYPSEYKTTIYIHKFNKDYESVYALKNGGRVTGTGNKSDIVYNFVNAFPLNISSIPVSYDTSQLLKVSVTFSYDRYYVDRTGNSVQSSVSEPAQTNQALASVTDFAFNPSNGNAIYNDFLNIGNSDLDQFGVQLPQGTRDQLGVTGAVISA